MNCHPKYALEVDNSSTDHPNYSFHSRNIFCLAATRNHEKFSGRTAKVTAETLIVEPDQVVRPTTSSKNIHLGWAASIPNLEKNNLIQRLFVTYSESHGSGLDSLFRKALNQ